MEVDMPNGLTAVHTAVINYAISIIRKALNSCNNRSRRKNISDKRRIFLVYFVG